MDTKGLAANPSRKKAKGLAEPIAFLLVFFGIFILVGLRMGAINMINTIMNTAFALLTDTVLYIMAVAVITGAISMLLTEFGVIGLLNRLLSPLMMPLYSMPGASSAGIMTTYLSDNPSILVFANDRTYQRYFKRYQIPALVNIGTAFGMGFIITSFMVGLRSPTGETFGIAVLVGNLGAIIGSVVSTRLMIRHTKKLYGTEAPGWEYDSRQESKTEAAEAPREKGFLRVINAILEGGKSGVKLGGDIIPGVLIICTLVMLLAKGPGEGGVYTGGAFEGVGLLPWIGDKLSFILKPLFGFTSSAGIAVPITALGASGASLALVPQLLQSGQAVAQDVAVFTAMCMCWSGYLSTHVAMMDSLKCSHLTGRAIFSHTIGGACAGISAHWLFKLIMLIAS